MCACLWIFVANANIGVWSFLSLIPDINECLNPDTCPNEQCENTPGSYECVPCLPGHEARAGTCYGEYRPAVYLPFCLFLFSFSLQWRSKDKPNIPISTEQDHSLGLSVLGFLKYAFASRPIILVCANSVLTNTAVKLLRSTYCRGKTKAKLSSMSSVVTDTWE